MPESTEQDLLQNLQTIARGGIADSTGAAGTTAAAPAAGTAVCATAALTVGTYIVEVTSFQSGTPDANAANMNLRHGTTVVSALPSIATAQTRRFRVTVAATETINVVTGAGAGGAGAIYNASLSVIQVA